ncbi:hypothetical protein [Bremerella alba]|uniref:Uncharacterized protein n=1 Tax=Bremerella alba TaxID=980252 RepID=A0A7V8V7G8_9BACT|nr:hypothetical protein [Bremerella alba]MBA2116399.1 hypothetical protein [Bremerella alba]
MARMSYRGITHTKVAKTKVASRDFRLPTQASRRRGGESGRTAESGGYFVPPEDWHEPAGDTGTNYKYIYQSPGEGFRHVLTEREIRSRLQELPAWMIEDLEVVQLSRLTKKKLSFPCYGMQWGAAIYLYPMDESLIEYFPHPPRPEQVVEAKMFGAIWEEDEEGFWRLEWTEDTIRDFYLNNVLIHELGHLLDTRNNNYLARERYAEWFAIEYGYRPTRRKQMADRAAKKVVRRHHHT